MSDGEHLIDGYQLINCIATGTYSQVWEVAEEGNANHLAMKLLLPEAFEDPEQKQALKHEAKVAKALNHPSIVKFHKVVIDKKHGYMIMDHFRAPNVKGQLTANLTFVQARAKKLIESVCLSLGYMHDNGWLHRDIKPENILFNRGSELRLIDFSLSCRKASGLSKMMGGKAKAIQGTRTYIAPETLRKAKPTPQTDMYSLGITIFEILTGDPPFVGVNPNELLRKHLQETAPLARQVNPNVTPEMSEFVARLLFKKPAKRHKDMNEVFHDFQSVKVFDHDPLELEKEAEAKKVADEEAVASLGDRVTSRRDAKLMEDGKRSATADGPQQKKPKPPASAPAQPQAPYPGAMPQQPMPGQPIPQPYQPVYQQPMAYPPQQQPAQPQPTGQQPAGWQQPPMPQPQFVQPPPGSVAAPPPQPQPQHPAAGQPQPPGTQPPAAPQQQAPPPPEAAPPESGDEDLPLMEDLPDVF